MKPEEVIEEIVWLENPSDFDYLREGTYLTTERNGKPDPGVYKLIGYENARKRGKGIQAYSRRIWYLKKHDRECPDELEEYKESEPAEAVSPEEIYIPSSARIIKKYKEPRAVPEAKSKKERNKLWRESEKEEKPFLILDKKRKYAEFKYDMWNTPYNLSDKGIEKLENQFKELVNKSLQGRKQTFKGRSITSSFGRTYGFFRSVRIHEARVLAEKMKEIIMNRDYWVKI